MGTIKDGNRAQCTSQGVTMALSHLGQAALAGDAEPSCPLWFFLLVSAGKLEMLLSGQTNIEASHQSGDPELQGPSPVGQTALLIHRVHPEPGQDTRNHPGSQGNPSGGYKAPRPGSE